MLIQKLNISVAEFIGFGAIFKRVNWGWLLPFNLEKKQVIPVGISDHASTKPSKSSLNNLFPFQS